MIYKEKDFAQGIEIATVSDFMVYVQEIQKENNDTIFFRGQETEFWPVLPSIFRDNLLSVEHTLMQEPLLKAPYDFKNTTNMFDTLTKYQHYNMCTRLLDLTTNPLVALYFACKQHGTETYELEDGSQEEKEPYGIVYFNKGFPVLSDDVNVKIIIAMSKMDLQKKNTFEDVLHLLYVQQIIDKEQKDRWLSEEYYLEFVKILQSNYVVTPVYSNERLSKQSGMFLLASCFNIEKGNTPKKHRISKGVDDLKDEFDQQYFYISGENKESILKELDIYNINEATLFPELEHQLNYIKNKNKERAVFVSSFTKLAEEKAVIITNENIDSVNIDTYTETVGNKIAEFIKDIDMQKKILEIAINAFNIVDWHKRDTILSQFRTQISKLLIDNNYSSVDAKIWAVEIVREAVSVVSNQTNS